jgi:hypothetical protein
LECDNHIPKNIKRKIKKDGIDKFPIVVKLYGNKTSCGK